MNYKTLIIITLTAAIFAGGGYADEITAPEMAAEKEKSPWTFETTLYLLAAGMSGDVTAKGINADVDVGFDKVLDHLEFGAMGKVRVAYKRVAVAADVIYTSLGAEKHGVSVDLEQWVVEPTVGYTVCNGFELLAGARYNSVSGHIHGPGIFPTPRVATGDQDWWDPIIGANVHWAFLKKFSLNLRGDVGGFDVGSDVTWQAFPYVGWQVADWGSLQAGYRWVYTHYETGGGASHFEYDLLTQGPQVGFTVQF